MEQVVRKHMRAGLHNLRGLSFRSSVKLWYTHPATQIVYLKLQYLHSGMLVLTHIGHLHDQLGNISEFLHEHEKYISENSALRVDYILLYRFKIGHKKLLAGRTHREVPDFLANKNAIVNEENRNNRCYGHAVMTAIEELEQSHHAHRPPNTNASSYSM